MSTVGGQQTIDCLLCRVHGSLCALPLEHAAEVMRPLPIRSLDAAPEGVLGVAVIRGAGVPVVSGAALLGKKGLGGAGRFVVLAVEGRHVALAVDDVLGVRRIPAHVLGAVPPLLSQSARGVSAIGALDAGLLLVLDAARLVPEDAVLSPGSRAS